MPAKHHACKTPPNCCVNSTLTAHSGLQACSCVHHIFSAQCLCQSSIACAGAPRQRRSNVQFDVEASPIVGEGSLKSASWARKPTSNRSTFDVERSPDLHPTDHAGVVMEADKEYQEEQVKGWTLGSASVSSSYSSAASTHKTQNSNRCMLQPQQHP